ncbi:AGAP006339-PA [Anopheles gambiae str. PEST]|uniref:AGAP006339-PA n=2 Tax=Anopheles gambiae TaxID=7165 RepID=A7UU72_ANOGA|nr:AGAP006339-PA [Anopheles gambiae str. PEST]
MWRAKVICMSGTRRCYNELDEINSDSASNYVDRVRIRDSSNSFGGPGRGSGWRQKSLSNIDLPTSYRGIAGGIGGGITGGGLGAGQFRYRDYDSGLYDLYSRIDSRREEYEDLYGVNPKAAREVIAYDKSSEHGGHGHHHHHHHHHGSQQQQAAQQQQFYNPDTGEACSLRRTRSLAVIREESYHDLHLPGRGGARRSQLIPRAKLIDRNFFKERFSYIYDDNGDVPEAPESDANGYTLARRFSTSTQTANGGPGQQQPFPWHTDKSDLDSIDSSIFKHSLHQQNSFDGSRRNSIRSDSTKFVSKVEVHSQYSGVSGGSKSDTGVDADLKLLDDLSLREEPVRGKSVATLDTVRKRSGKFGPRDEDESGITIIEIKDSQVSHKSSSVISYDSIYLSSESDEKELLDEQQQQQQPATPSEDRRRRRGKEAALIEAQFEEYEELFHEVDDLESTESTIDTLYGQVTKPKPKIVGVEPKKLHPNDSLRRYTKHNTGRSTIERLSIISNLKLRQEFGGGSDPPSPGSRKDRAAALPPVDSDYQYNSLPDADVCKILRNSERIDAKLRRIADSEHDGDAASRKREFDSLPRLNKANLNLTRPPSDEDTSLEESDKGAPSIEVVETPTKEVQGKVYLQELGVELDYENSVVAGNSDQESDITIVAPQESLELTTPAIVVTPADKKPASSSSVIYSTFASTVGKQTTTKINFESKERQKPEPDALREVRTKLKPVQQTQTIQPKVPLALAPTVKLGGRKVIVDEVAAKAVQREKELGREQAPPTAPKNGVQEQVAPPVPKKPPKDPELPQEVATAVGIPIANAKTSNNEPETDLPPAEEKQGSPKVDHSSLFKDTNPFKEQARREIKHRVNDRPLFKGVRRFNSTENIFTSTPIIVTKTFNNCIKTNEVKTKSFDSLIVESSQQCQQDKNKLKMPRPQVIQIVDSKQPPATNGADTLRKTSKNGQQTQREFLHKVDSVRSYWSKMLDEVEQLTTDSDAIRTEEALQNAKNELLTSSAAASAVAAPPGAPTNQVAAYHQQSLSKNGNAGRKSSIGSATSEASDGSNRSTNTGSTRTVSSGGGQHVRPSAATTGGGRNKYSTYQLEDDEQHEDGSDLRYQSFSPTVEIIELDGHKQAALVKPKNARELDFDHVRYKVMKSEMFQKNLLVNHRKAAQFDGLMQYLQDYSFQELLAHNNVVIIEPVRTKIEKISEKPPHAPAAVCRITNGALGVPGAGGGGGRRPNVPTNGAAASGIKKHFFYHPIRVNKELLDEELPSPDTVRNVRKLFEGTLRLGTAAKQAYEEAKANGTAGIRKWDSASLSSGVSSSGDLSSPCDCGEPGEDAAAATSIESQLAGELESHYVSQDVLEKIRECGSTVTYYGGRVLDKRTEAISTMTRAIMREIRGQDRQCGVCQPHGCHRHSIADDERVAEVDEEEEEEEDEQDEHDHAHGCSGSLRRPLSGEREGGLGVKFKLVKSNSCSSRLELAGTGKTPPDLLRPNGRMRGRHILPEESSTRGTVEATIEEPEESVRDMVSRLESGNGATLITGRTTANKPRIIESRCIEKYEPAEPAITINSQTTVDGGTTITAVGSVVSERKSPVPAPPAEPGVTVNNHINVVQPVASIPQPPPIPGPLVIPPLLRGGPAKTLPSIEVAAAAVPPSPPTAPAVMSGATSMERPPKVCRNRNVDLAFAATMRQLVGLNGNGTVLRPPSAVKKSSSQVSVHGAESNDQSPPDSAPSSAASVTKTVTFNFTNGASAAATEQTTNGHEESQQHHHTTNGTQQQQQVVDQSENLRPSAIAEQRKLDELTSPKLVNWSSIGRFDERQYFANDRKLIEKRKYDDMEFEEFEVLDPNAPPEHYDSLNSK